MNERVLNKAYAVLTSCKTEHHVEVFIRWLSLAVKRKHITRATSLALMAVVETRHKSITQRTI